MEPEEYNNEVKGLAFRNRGQLLDHISIQLAKLRNEENPPKFWKSKMSMSRILERMILGPS